MLGMDSSRHERGTAPILLTFARASIYGAQRKIMVEGSSGFEADGGVDANVENSKSRDEHAYPQASELSNNGDEILARHDLGNENDLNSFQNAMDFSETRSPIRHNGNLSHDNSRNMNASKIQAVLENGQVGYGNEKTSTIVVNSGEAEGTSLSSSGDQNGYGCPRVASNVDQYQQISSPASASVQSKRSSPQRPERALPTSTSTPPMERVSLLSRGMSLFAKSPSARHDNIGYSARNDNDAISVISELTHDVKTECKSNKTIEESDIDDALKVHLEESGLILLKRLIEFLSECPDESSEYSSLSELRDDSSQYNANSRKRHRGLTLPASAIGWLSTQILHDSSTGSDRAREFCTVPKQQLECLHSLLRRVSNLRVSGEAWPPPHHHASMPSSKAAEEIARSAKKSISMNIISKLVRDQTSTTTEGDILEDGGSCGATPSRCSEDGKSLSDFQRYYDEILHKPDVNMSFFPNATKVIIDGIPPNWVTHLDSLQKLDMFQMEKGCILDINQLFFPSDTTNGSSIAEARQNDSSVLEAGCNDNVIEEGREADANRSETPPFVYSSLTKLSLSNCAIGEAAGLRRRRTSRLSLPPPLERFPNLVSLDLSRNELFRTKTAFAGLSSLPLLSSINLSYNRLSSMDDIFMHIGNITELILTGNEISTTRGLDRIFSLELLSLDENKIQQLTHISAIAKMPFLMNFDLKGNPFEIDDPATCRVQVFNLFREIRCNKLPKDATFRDMQRLLPILDNELATKDELVALKALTYRHAVMPMDEIPSTNNADGSADVNNIDDRSEIFVNMPDPKGHIRRIVKSSLVNLAHLRMPVSVPSTEKATGQRSRIDSHIFRDDQRSVSVLFSMEELLKSVRQTVVRDSLIDQNHIIRRETLQSVSSFLSESNAAITGDSDDSPSMSFFPFGLPPSLLAEADDDVWNPNQLIPPSDSILWELMDCDDEVANGDHNSHITMFLEEQPVNDDESGRPESIQSDGEITADLISRKSELNGIWEKSYHDTVLTRQMAESEPINLAERNADLLDLSAAEQRSRYDGPPDYGTLFVSSDTDLYFDTFVFPRDSSEDGADDFDGRRVNMAPRIQLFKFDRDLIINSHRQQGIGLPVKIDFHERFIGIWKVDVLACGTFARSRLPPMKAPMKGFHGDTITRAGKDEMISESRKFILCLSEAAVYFIIDDDVSSHKPTGQKRPFPSRIPPKSTFSDACWPHAVVRHPLDCLRGITIGFQFQRLILRFSISNAATSTSLEFTYVLLTSNKLQTISLLQKVPVHAAAADDCQLPGMCALIDNDDKTFLDSLGSPKSNEVVIHYQILLQCWKRRERQPTRRAFVLTDSRVCLIDETYFGDGTHPEEEKDKTKKLGDVSLAIIDSAALSQVTEVRAANEDPRKITLVILPQNKLKRAHRWRLICNDGESAERLVEDVRKAMGVRV